MPLTRSRVWTQIASSLANLRSVFSQNETLSTGLKKFTRELVGPTVKKLGWEFEPDESYLTGQLRRLLISVAGGAGDERYVRLFRGSGVYN